MPAFAGWEDPGAAFTAVIQLGTMAAVVVYFRRDLARIAVAFKRSIRGERWRSADIDARMGWYIALGTIPISVAGLVFSNQIEDGARSLYLAGITLILFSFVMLAAERYVPAHPSVDVGRAPTVAPDRAEESDGDSCQVLAEVHDDGGHRPELDHGRERSARILPAGKSGHDQQVA